MTTNEKPELTPKLRFLEFRDQQGWSLHKLGDKAAILKGKGISKADLDLNGSQPCIRYGELYTFYGETIKSVASRTNVPASELFLSKANDVIVPSSGETKIDIATASCVLLDDVALGGDLNVIRSTLNGQFLSYYLNGPKKFDIAKVAQGDTVVHLYPHQLSAQSVAVPPPAEQEKIAGCLSTLDELIGAESQKLDALKANKKGLVQRLFPREGEALPQIRFAEFQNASEWEERTLAGIAEIRSGTTPARANPEYYVGGSIPWVKTTDLNNSFITKTEESVTPLAKVRVNPVESILIAMYGGFNQIGRTGCLSIPSATNQAISVLVVDRTKAAPAYVLAWLNAKVSTWKRIASSSRKDPNITGADVARFSIYLPQISEQDRIVSFLFSLNELIAAQVDKLEALKTHKNGLVQQLFPYPPEAET